MMPWIPRRLRPKLTNINLTSRLGVLSLNVTLRSSPNSSYADDLLWLLRSRQSSPRELEGERRRLALNLLKLLYDFIQVILFVLLQECRSTPLTLRSRKSLSRVLSRMRSFLLKSRRQGKRQVFMLSCWCQSPNNITSIGSIWNCTQLELNEQLSCNVTNVLLQEFSTGGHTSNGSQ